LTEVKTKPGLSADEQLDRLIDSRFSPEDDARIEAAWAESAMRHNLAAAAERRRQWIDYHLGLERLHTTMAAEHRHKAMALIDGAGG
jgi:hypothetical protein